MKLNKKCLAVMMLVVMMLPMTVCGAIEWVTPMESLYTELAGTWEVNWDATLEQAALEANIPADVLEATKAAYKDIKITFVIDEAGAGTEIREINGQEEVYPGTFMISGDTVFISYYGECQYEILGDRVILKQDGVTQYIIDRKMDDAALIPATPVVDEPIVDEPSQSSIIGTWETMWNETIDATATRDNFSAEEVEELKQYYATGIMQMYVEFDEAGWMTVTQVKDGQSQVDKSMYEVSGDELIINGTGFYYELDGDVLKIDEVLMYMVLKRK